MLHFDLGVTLMGNGKRSSAMTSMVCAGVSLRMLTASKELKSEEHPTAVILVRNIMQHQLSNLYVQQHVHNNFVYKYITWYSTLFVPTGSRATDSPSKYHFENEIEVYILWKYQTKDL